VCCSTGARPFLVRFIGVAVIVAQFLPGTYISEGDDPDASSGEFCCTVRVTGMVDVAGFVPEGCAVDIIMIVKLEDISVAAGRSPVTFFFGNLFAVIPNNPGVCLDILCGE